MGYTNYWTYKKPFDNNEWSKIKDEYDYIVENFDGTIIKNETPVKHKDEVIVFNGVGANSHETFVLFKDFTLSCLKILRSETEVMRGKT